MRPLAAAVALLAAARAGGAGPWDLEALRQPPKATYVGKGPVREVYYDGEPFRGKPTRVWGYSALPQKREGKVPAMVLVHGGGGTAFREWAELWARRGYAALAMDLGGCGPGRKRLPDGGPTADDENKFFFKGADRDFWSYHAVAAVIRGASLLASLPEVDKERIGITGISWGGYLTSIVIGLDDRLKVAVPVYGCGFIHESNTWDDFFPRMKPAARRRWVKNFDPSRYLADAKMPVLFVNGTNDFAFPLDIYQKSYRLVKDRALAVTVELPHGHVEGWTPVEIGLFADQHLKKGKPLAKVVSSKRDGDKVEVRFEPGVPVLSAALHYTADKGEWHKRKWKSIPLVIKGDTIRGTVPDARPVVYFVTLTDERKATVSTEHEELAR